MRGKYRSKPITAVVMDGVITRFEYEDKKGHWHFPLIEDGKNVDEHLFELEGEGIVDGGGN